MADPDFIPASDPDFIPAEPRLYSRPPARPAATAAQPGFWNTLGREASSLGSSLASIPGTTYHAFADPTTPEEMRESRGLDVFPGVTGISRLTAQPLATAVRWYRDAAQGKIPNAYEQALSVAPEAMGQGAAGPLAGKLAEMAPELPGAVAKVGPPLVRGAARGTNAALAKAPAVVGATAGSAVAGWPGAAVGYALGKEILPKLRVPGENFGLPPPDPTLSPTPAFSKVPLGPPAPDPALLQGNALRTVRATEALPAAQTGEALGRIPVAAARPSLIEQMQAPEVSAEPEVAAPQSRLIDRMQAGTEGQEPSLKVKATKDYPRLVDQMKTSAAPELSRPVTENPVVGSLVRAMQKSGLPIAERPNLLLKGSGRVNRILGPEEDLTNILTKSARQARRQREQ